MKKNILFLAVFTILAGSILYAQTPEPTAVPTTLSTLAPCPCATLPPGGYFDYHGVVRDVGTSVPISGASVSYSLVDYSTYRGSSTTNTSGYYRFTVNGLPCIVPPARIIVSAPGYIAKEISISGGSGCSSNLLNIELDVDGTQPTPVPAQEYSIAGTVNITESVRIRLSGDASGEVMTDSSGNYVFSHLSPGGNYTIEPITGPLVEITYPQNNQTIQSEVDVSASVNAGIERLWLPESRSITALNSNLSAEDFYHVLSGNPIALSNVAFWVDDIQEQTGTTDTFSWDTRSFSNGTHTLKVTAEDVRGNIDNHEILVNIDNAITTGDVNNDGSVDIIDALLVAQYYVGLNPANFNPAFADANCNGAVDIVDALLISQYYVGLISQLC